MSIPISEVRHGWWHLHVQQVSIIWSWTMNNANQIARQQTAIDILNGVILLLKLEAEQFCHYKQLAWEWEDILTDKGMKLMEECFDEVDVMDYIMSGVPIDNGHRATVKKRTVNATQFLDVILSEGHLGTRFGSCTCGKPNRWCSMRTHGSGGQVPYNQRSNENSTNALLVDNCPLASSIPRGTWLPSQTVDGHRKTITSPRQITVLLPIMGCWQEKGSSQEWCTWERYNRPSSGIERCNRPSSGIGKEKMQKAGLDVLQVMPKIQPQH